MDSRDLTPEQAAKLWQQLGPHLRYLNRLRRRMEERGFLANDELRRLVEKAYDATPNARRRSGPNASLERRPFFLRQRDRNSYAHGAHPLIEDETHKHYISTD